MIDANRKCLDALGKNSLNDVLGRRMAELFGWEFIDMFIPAIEEMQRTGRPVRLEYRFGPLD